MPRKVKKTLVPQKSGLVIRPGTGVPLSRTQTEFNRLMKSLEGAKKLNVSEQSRLDGVLSTVISEVMPLVEQLNHSNRKLILGGHKALHALKLTAARKRSFVDLLVGKIADLLDDPVGLSEEEIAELEAIFQELDPAPNDEEMETLDRKEFDGLRATMEQAARMAGLELDLGDLDLHDDPGEFARIAEERLREAYRKRSESPATERPRRKPTKVQAEKERKRAELEQAKSRDLKSLFKQLAKAFHPDLEPNPLLKKHKEVWMTRLNTAYAATDLREMLQLEMEWLGEEATNLASAGDEKLKVYCMVLKEQIAELKRQTLRLPFEPQYGPLQRFRDPFYGTLASPKTLARALREDAERHREMLEVLSAHDAASRRMIYAWADENARRSRSYF